MNGRTAMAVVYRQSTLQRFDRIIVMDRGHIIDDGTAAELAWPVQSRSQRCSDCSCAA